MADMPTDSIPEAGFQMDLWRKHRFDACCCPEGAGTVGELDNGTVPEFKAGKVLIDSRKVTLTPVEEQNL